MEKDLKHLTLPNFFLRSPLVMVDLKQANSNVMQTYRPLQPPHGAGLRVGSCVTPCGSSVFCGSQGRYSSTNNADVKCRISLSDHVGNSI